LDEALQVARRVVYRLKPSLDASGFRHVALDVEVVWYDQ
jgi:hypothetical protein